MIQKPHLQPGQCLNSLTTPQPLKDHIVRDYPMQFGNMLTTFFLNDKYEATHFPKSKPEK